jgi:hypothetical protein
VHRQEVELPHFPAGFLQFLPAGRVVYRIVRDNSLQLPAEGRASARARDGGKKGGGVFPPLAGVPGSAADPEAAGDPAEDDFFALGR